MEPTTLDCRDKELAMEPTTLDYRDKELAMEPTTLDYRDKELAMEPTTLDYRDKELAMEPTTLDYRDQELAMKSTTHDCRDKELAIGMEQLVDTWVGRISSHVSRPTKEPACRKAPQDHAGRGQQAQHTTILLCKSRSSEAALLPQEHRMFMEEAYNAAICFKMLRDINSSDPLHLKYIIKKVKNMAEGSPNLVMETIHDYFTDNPELSSRHKFRLFQVLKNVIGVSDTLEQTWKRRFMKLALENMTKSTELEDIYQNAASDVLVALCQHSWLEVAQHLETELLTGVFPHRSLLYVMGVLSSHKELLNKEDRARWEELLAQIAVKSVPFLNTDVWSKELLWALTKPSRTQQEQLPEKTFLFTYYGMILQAEEDSATVRTHLQSLLETSHQWPKQREGIALTVGLAASRHLNDVWAILDQFGRSGPIKWSLHSFSLKGPSSEDLRWKWASSTILLAYGQVAASAKAHILPWVDNILSRMIFYFRYSSWDENLKQSFLTATLMLMGAISRNEGAHSYEFSQTSELLECLVVLMEKEPQDALYTESRRQALNIVCSLCRLRPPMDLNRKSRLLSTCLRSVFSLPLLDALEKHTCLFLEPPNIQLLYSQTTEALDCVLQSFITQSPTAEELHFLLSHLYVWLASEKAHERQRAVHSCATLLKFLNHQLCLDPKEGFKRIGQLVGMLGILCQDPDRATQRTSLEGVGHLYQLLMRQKAGETLQVESLTPKEFSQPSADGAPLWSSGDQKATPLDPQELASPKDGIFHLDSSQALKELMRHLLMAEVTDLIWTAISGLGSSSPFRVQAAAELLLAVIHQHGAKLETVANMGRGIHLRLCSVRIPQAKENALHAITLLARNHTPELVAAFLDFSMPLDSHAFRLWRALGAEQPVSRLVLAMLLAWLQERPLPARAINSSPNPKEKTYLRSLAAMNTLLELQFAREFKKAVREAYPQLLLALLTQVHYTLELNLAAEPQRGQQAQEASMPSPQSTSLEALKSLLSTTGHWHDFAHLELQGAWEHFTSIHTYAQGVGLLARAMVQNCCWQIKAVLSWLLRRVQSQEERERKAAILVLTEFLYSPVLLEVLPKQSALTLLAQGLRDDSPEVRVASLQGLGNILFHPEKGRLLRGQLPPFLNGFFQNSESVVVDIMGTVSEVLHRLGSQGAGAQSLSVAINARSFFDDERDRIRAAAMALFGDLVATMVGRELSGLRTQVYQSMVPLLLHLKDTCPKVVTQAKFAFYRCALLLGWRPRHTLFCTLAWERGLSARHFLWTCLMRSSSEEFSIHLAQALSYLHSHHQHMKTWAALFIGYTIIYHPQAVSRMVSEVDTNLLFCTFEDLKKDPEPGVREFASRQLSFLREVSEGRQQ
ncbi:Maestro heat-like repeat family member 5 [Sciurus carolinensis]|uniref:Maestro heat-like repeat family member 5 n=1 Tax=Sciurus carolinensis TaxID=30640 RepID=A0AA41N365_SCICA|nr:Maestro heat-like repeat family member 5 [Sciurus carolinensis]